jgi:HD-GYP domain-containing protein (c-di-GMP phosphodiesterase class II)
MRSHSVLGDALVKEQLTEPYRLEVAAIVRHHHERWDGRGYPDELAGEAIPVSARIVSIVDSFDAMTSARPYHRARSPATVIETMRSERGSKYDPSLLDLFLSGVVNDPGR